MKKNVILIVIIIASLNGEVFTQDTLFLLNGDIRPCEIHHVDSAVVAYRYPQKKKIKQREISTELVYRIQFKNGISDTLYDGNKNGISNLNTEQMGIYLMGMHDAKKKFKTPFVTLGGVAFNFGIGFLLYDNMLAAIGPIAYTAALGATPIKIKALDDRPYEITNDPNYQNGYLKIARNKKVFNALSGSLLGLVIGITVGNAAN